MTQHEHGQASAAGPHRIKLTIHHGERELEFEGEATISELVPLVTAVFGERGGMTAAEVTALNRDLAGRAERLETLAEPDSPAAT